jgi:hypothetical protein
MLSSPSNAPFYPFCITRHPDEIVNLSLPQAPKLRAPQLFSSHRRRTLQALCEHCQALAALALLPVQLSKTEPKMYENNRKIFNPTSKFAQERSRAATHLRLQAGCRSSLFTGLLPLL